MWRRWLSLKDRDLAPADKVARVTPCKAASHAFGSRYFECPPSAGWGRKWSPGLPGAHCPDRQPWLGASACLRAWMASLPSQRGTDERCHAAPWRRGWTRACSQTGLVRATEAKALSRSWTPRPRAPAGREVCAGPVERRPAPWLPAAGAESGSGFVFWWGREQYTTVACSWSRGLRVLRLPASRVTVWGVEALRSASEAGRARGDHLDLGLCKRTLAPDPSVVA